MTNCDRCIKPTLVVKKVICYYGCSHGQCEACAEQTSKERDEEKRYDQHRAEQLLALSLLHKSQFHPSKDFLEG